MGDIWVPGHKIFWTINYTEVGIPDISATISRRGRTVKMLFKVLGVAGHTPPSRGQSAEWTAIVNAGEVNGTSYC
jgi:hypothetical protein